MAKIARYNLDVFNKITFDGFDFKLPEDTIHIISELSLQVGSPSYVKTPVFQKRENPLKTPQENNINTIGMKKKRTKNTEILNDDDWETLRTFQTTKIEQKVGLEAKFDIIRSYLNKLSDKSYSDFKNKIMETMKEIMSEYTNSEDILRFGTSIFEIASTNRFYSKLYAELYAELIENFDVMGEVFYNSFDTFLEMFNKIEYIDPSVDYDKFCKINKDNEKRKALSAFFVNLMLNKVISEEKIVMLLQNLLTQIYTFISTDNKKNEVDELTENIAILYKKELFENKQKYIEFTVAGLQIPEVIAKLANSKSKDYLSLSNKSIFKFMDVIDM